MYRAPVGEIAFTLRHVTGLGQALGAGLFPTLSDDLLDAILAEAGRFASDEIAPLRKVGDRVGSRLDGHAVTTPPGWPDLYRRWTEGGWNALTGPEAFGGQALPHSLAMAALEMWIAGSVAFALAPTLTMGAVEALHMHGSETLKQLYLPKLVSGEWTGTMHLTEPQAGSDLGAIRTRAEPAGDGTYRLFGQKIFITFGEHDLARNIVHFVLARMAGAPAGTRGLSLFLVPKFLPGEGGGLGRRNDAFCVGLEEKLGIHASPTCVMAYGDGLEGAERGAVGWLVGEENRGLACMFTMMNNARLAIGMQGVGVAEAAFQQALAYARERRQGKAAGWSGEGMAPIVNHPDVQRMLLTMKALTRAARAVAYSCAHAIDMAGAGPEDERGHWQQRADLLTPVAKAFSTDIGVEVASLGIQVHGGMGYIEETGAAALWRDARIAPIYEGTNGIQAIDLVTRKLPVSGGDHLRGYIGELRAVAQRLRASSLDGFGTAAARLDAACDALSAATEHLLACQRDGRAEEALAGATPYLRLFGLVAGGASLAVAALAQGESDRVALCRFYAETLLGESGPLRDAIVAGSAGMAAAAAFLTEG
ncbi:MAG: acyl-CoA dehydrogenase [Rhizobiaceae bacterium]